MSGFGHDDGVYYMRLIFEIHKVMFHYGFTKEEEYEDGYCEDFKDLFDRL